MFFFSVIGAIQMRYDDDDILRESSNKPARIIHCANHLITVN